MRPAILRASREGLPYRTFCEMFARYIGFAVRLLALISRAVYFAVCWFRRAVWSRTTDRFVTKARGEAAHAALPK